MNKKTLLSMMMLLCFAFCGAARAQEVTVYDGTSTSGYIPAYVFYFDDFTRSQFVIPASDLTAINGNTIQSMTFYTNAANVPYTTVSSADVYLMEVGYTSINAFEPKASATIVYSGYFNIVSEGDGGTMTINFNTPFTYNGGNLLVGIENTEDVNYKNINFYGQTVTGASVSGSNANSLGNVQPIQQNFIPKTTFIYSFPGGCNRPMQFTANEVGPESATLSWIENGNSESWYIFYHAETDGTAAPEEESIEVFENPYTLTGLMPYTSYEAFVIPSCGVEDDDPNNILMSNIINFTTLEPCPTPQNVAVTNITDSQATVAWSDYNEAYQVQLGSLSDSTETLLNESFDNGFSWNWSNDPTYPWTFVDGHLQSGNAGVASSTSSISLSMDLDGPGIVEFDAECRGEGTSTYWDHCDFFIDNERVFYHGADLTNAGWNHYSFNVTTGYHTFTWSYTKDSSTNPTGDYFAIDNVVVSINEFEWREPVEVLDPSYTFTGLDQFTEYYVQVQGICGLDAPRPTITSWSELVSFSTLGHYNVTVGVNPADAGTVTGGGEFLSGDTCTVTAVPNAHFYFDSWLKNGTSVSYDSIYSFVVTENTNLVAKFWAMTYYAWVNSYPQNGGSAGFFEHDPIFYYGDTVTLHASPSVGYEFVNWTVWNGDEYVSLSSDTLFTFVWDDFYANLMGGGGQQDGIEFIANFIGDCMPPTQLTASEVGPNFATLNWTELGTSESWYIFYRDMNPSPTYIPFDTIQVTENPFTLTYLQPSTSYEVYVVPSCGIEDGVPDETLMSEIIEFTTLEACPTPWNIEVTDITYSTATVSWTGYNDIYTVHLGIPNPNNLLYETFANDIPTDWTNDATYPWTIVDGHMQSGNAGVSSSTSAISVTMTYPYDGFIDFDAECKGEGTSSYWDHCDFYIDTTRVLIAGENIMGWNHYSFDVTAGSHTFTWSYTKDGSVDPTGDYFAVDNIRFTKEIEWESLVSMEDATIIFTDLTPLTMYGVRVQGECEAGQQDIITTDWSQPVFFTTTDAVYYTITASANPAAGGNVTGGGTYMQGASCTLTATANTGYTFTNWTKNDGTVVSNNATYTFNVTESGAYAANFTLNSYMVTASANPAEGGTVTGGGTYNHGQNITLTATANEGYTFTSWSDGVTTNPRTVTVTGPATYVANFELQSFNITVSADPTEGGTVSGGGTYNYGSSVTLTATPSAGYVFLNWTKNGAVVSTNASYAINVTEAGNYVAHFSQNSYTLTINYMYADGSIAAPTHTENLSYGTSYNVTSPAITGYTPDQAVVSGTMGAENLTVNVTYNVNSYTLTINYKYANGTTAAPTHIESLNYGASYSVTSPTVTGYTPSLPVVSGTMGAEDVTVDVTYSDNSYTLTVNYKFADGTTAAPTHTENVSYGASYSVTSPTITGYTPDLPVVSDTMGAEDVTVDVTYNINSYTLTINYKFTNGTTAAPTHTESLDYGASYSVTSPAITGYTPNLAVVSGTMGTEDVTVDVTYSVNSYTLTINYKFTNGTTAAPTHTESLGYGASYSVTSPAITGYTPNLAVVSGTMGAEDVTVDVTYSDNSYTLTINYKYANGTTAAPTYTENVSYGASYSVTSPTITGYTPNLPVVSGTMDAEDVTVDVTYTINSYTLTINYKFTNGTTAAPTYTESLDYGASYSVTSPAIIGYTPNLPVVSGTMGTENLTVDVTYNINSYTLTINYKFADGTTAAPTYTESFEYGASYSITSPSITGYTPNLPVVSGTMGAEDVTVDVTYSDNNYTLTINYKYANGTTAAPTYTENVSYGASYSVTSPAITGYTPNLPVVSGTMGAEDVTVDVTYNINSYTLTINYKFTNGTTAAPTYTESLDYGASYSITSPAITGYTPDLAVVTGTMGAEDVTVDVTYNINSYTLTINYKFTNGTTAAPTYTESLDYGASYSVTSPAITGYTPDLAVVTGTMGTENVTVDVTYTINSYTLTINYKYADGTTAAPTHTESLDYGASYSVTSPAITGYTPDLAVVTGTMGAEDVTVDVTYSVNSYTLTINYKYTDGTTAAPTYTESLDYGASYSVTSPAITGYTPDLAVVTGTMGTENVTVDVTYTINSYTLTVNYLYADGTTAAPTYTENVSYGASYSVTSPTITGYTPDLPVVSGTMGAEDVTVDVTYTINSYTLTINYKYADGTTAAATHTESVNYGVSYSVTSPAITGYTPDLAVVTGTMGTENVTVDVTYTINSYTLTVNYKYADGTTAAATHTESVNYGVSYSVTSPAITGYTPDLAVVTGTMGTENVTVDVTYTINSYIISASANPTVGGSVNGAGTYNHFATAELTAIASTGYTFINWTENGTVVSTSPTISFMVEGPRTLVANFQLNSYQITAIANPTVGGTATGTGIYNHFETCTLVATPNEYYIFTNWTKNGQVVSNDATYSFTVEGGGTYVAHFTRVNHQITALANPTEGGSVSGEGSFPHGSYCTLTATANTGYTFFNWTKNGQVVSSNPSYSFSVTEDATYVANFNLNNYTITVSADPTAGGTVSGGGAYLYGNNCTVSAMANAGYTFTNWTKNGTVVSTDASYTFTVTENANLVAHFSLDHYNVTVSVDPEAGGTATGGGSFNYGETCNLSATPNTGYAFVNWTKNGSVVSTNASYSFTVTDNGDYVAHFSVARYTITLMAQPSEGGSVHGAGTYNYGHVVTLRAIAHEGYEFINWTKDGAVVSSNANYPIVVHGNAEYVANFRPYVFEIKANTNPDNSGDIEGIGLYNYGETCTLTVTPHDDYEFVNWTLNGQVVSEEESISFVVTEAREYVAHLQYVDGIDEQSNLSVTLYPNPAKFRLTIEASETIKKLEIYTIDGALVSKQDYSSDKIVISVDTLASGTYMIRLTTDSTVETRRFVKE